MDGFILRIIAMSTMVIDHIGWFFLDNPMALTWIGRIAFPIYAFLLADGFHHICGDRDRLSRHLAIMLILAVVSEPAFDLMDFGLDVGRYLNSQSNMITLLLGYAGMLATQAMTDSERIGKRLRIAALISAYGLMGFANYMLKGNFNVVGPLLVIAFYWVIRASGAAGQGGRGWSWGRRFSVLVCIFAVYLCLYFWVRSGFGDTARWWKEVVNYAPWILGHGIAAFIISLYNGELGYHEKWFSRLYLSFYPVHTLVIGVIGLLARR